MLLGGLEEQTEMLSQPASAQAPESSLHILNSLPQLTPSWVRQSNHISYRMILCSQAESYSSRLNTQGSKTQTTGSRNGCCSHSRTLHSVVSLLLPGPAP